MTPAQAFLANLQIASPCDAAWDDMTGDARKRLCAQCDKHVYDVSNLTTAEVMALFEAGGPAPCLRLWRRADGTVLTADCPMGLRRVRGRRRTHLAASLVLGLLASASSLLRAQQPLMGAPPAQPRPERLMGKVACPPPIKPQGAKPRPKGKGKVKPVIPPVPTMGAVAVPLGPTLGEGVAPPIKTDKPSPR